MCLLSHACGFLMTIHRVIFNLWPKGQSVRPYWRRDCWHDVFSIVVRVHRVALSWWGIFTIIYWHGFHQGRVCLGPSIQRILGVVLKAIKMVGKVLAGDFVSTSLLWCGDGGSIYWHFGQWFWAVHMSRMWGIVPKDTTIWHSVCCIFLYQMPRLLMYTCIIFELVSFCTWRSPKGETLCIAICCLLRR